MFIDNRFTYAEKQISDFDKAIDQNGWLIYEQALPQAFIDEIKIDLVKAHILRKQIQEKNGISARMGGTLHHLLERDNFGLSFLQKMYCHEEITHYFESNNYILNGFNAVIHNKQQYPYLSHIHRDVRSYMRATKYLVQMIVTLDDFTLQNGATYFLSGSHKNPQKPNEAQFFKNACRAVAPRGSLILFDSNIWHAAGENLTNKPRSALTLGFSPPWLKQQLDYPRFLGYDFVALLSPQLRQVTGYNARVPATLEEYYQLEHLRKYKPGLE